MGNTQRKVGLEVISLCLGSANEINQNVDFSSLHTRLLSRIPGSGGEEKEGSSDQVGQLQSAPGPIFFFKGWRMRRINSRTFSVTKRCSLSGPRIPCLTVLSKLHTFPRVPLLRG